MTTSDSTGGRERSVIETFDRKARTYSEGYAGDSSVAHSFNTRLQRVYELLEGCRGHRVLDVGCGPGITLPHLIERGFDCYGVDISNEMIAQCRRDFAHLPAAHFLVGSIEALAFPDAHFDVVLCIGVVEYLENDRAAVSELARVVKPGGSIIVSLPNRYSPYRVWHRTVYRAARSLVQRVVRRPARDLEIEHREFSERGYRRLLASSHLEVTDVVSYNFKLLVFPLDRIFPGLTVVVSRALERLARGPMRWLGTGLILKADRM